MSKNLLFEQNLTFDSLKRMISFPAKFIGNENIVLEKVSSLDNPCEHAICFVNSLSDKNIESVNRFEKSLIFVNENQIDLIEKCHKKNLFATVANPRLAFVRVLTGLFRTEKKQQIHPTAVISPKAQIGQNVYIGPHCIVGECSIGDGSSLLGNVYIADRVQIGKNVVIKPGATIGCDGFGYEKNEEGVYEKFPHLGGVIIEDGVDVGANTCIDRGVLGQTLIRKNSKIDNLVHIAHNVKTGENNMIVALAEISGSTTLGDNVWIAPGAKVLDKLVIGKDSFIGIGAVVTKSVPEKHRVTPAFSTIKPPKV